MKMTIKTVGYGTTYGDNTDDDDRCVKQALSSFVNQYPGVLDLNSIDMKWMGIADQRINMFVLTVQVNTSNISEANKALTSALTRQGLRLQ